jgi:hypothetical protein
MASSAHAGSICRATRGPHPSGRSSLRQCLNPLADLAAFDVVQQVVWTGAQPLNELKPADNRHLADVRLPLREVSPDHDDWIDGDGEAELTSRLLFERACFPHRRRQSTVGDVAVARVVDGANADRQARDADVSGGQVFRIDHVDGRASDNVVMVRALAPGDVVADQPAVAF